MPRATLTLLLAPLAACGLAPGEASDPAATAGSTGEATQSASAHPTTTADHDPTTTGHESTSHATTAAPACDPTPLGPAAADPYSLMVDGQLAWSHDSGHPAGWFHTYDAFDRGAPEHSPHKIHVLLPRGHDPCGAPYPLIVMNDGDTSFWPGGAGNKTWDVAGALAQLYDEGALPPVVVVAIVPNDREYEYSHAPAFAFKVGQDLHWYEDPLGEHDEVTWARHLPEALRALFSP